MFARGASTTDIVDKSPTARRLDRIMCDFQEIHITLEDGYEAYARYFPADPCIAAAVHFHGIQSHGGWYSDTARALRGAGVSVLQPDRRGSGRNQLARGHAASSEQLIDDARRCVLKLRDLTGQDRIHLIGVSWGGKLVAALHATDASLAASLALVAPGIFPVVDVSAGEKFKIGLSMISSPEKLFDIPLNDPELFTGDPRWIQFLRDDPLQIHQATSGFYLASRRMDRVVARLPESSPVPVHLMLAERERIIDNPRTRQFVRNMLWPERHITTYVNSRHTFEFGPDRDQYISDLIRWVRNPATFAALVGAT